MIRWTRFRHDRLPFPVGIFETRTVPQSRAPSLQRYIRATSMTPMKTSTSM